MDPSLLLALLHFYLRPTLDHHRPRHPGTLRRLLRPLDDDQLYDWGPSVASTASDAEASSVAPKTAAECAFAFLCASGELPEDYDARQLRKQQKKKKDDKEKKKKRRARRPKRRRRINGAEGTCESGGLLEKRRSEAVGIGDFGLGVFCRGVFCSRVAPRRRVARRCRAPLAEKRKEKRIPKTSKNSPTGAPPESPIEAAKRSPIEANSQVVGREGRWRKNVYFPPGPEVLLGGRTFGQADMDLTDDSPHDEPPKGQKRPCCDDWRRGRGLAEKSPTEGHDDGNVPMPQEAIRESAVASSKATSLWENEVSRRSPAQTTYFVSFAPSPK